MGIEDHHGESFKRNEVLNGFPTNFPLFYCYWLVLITSQGEISFFHSSSQFLVEDKIISCDIWVVDNHGEGLKESRLTGIYLYVVVFMFFSTYFLTDRYLKNYLRWDFSFWPEHITWNHANMKFNVNVCSPWSLIKIVMRWTVSMYSPSNSVKFVLEYFLAFGLRLFLSK